MSCWQCAQLTIMVDGRAVPESTLIVRWHGPGPGTDQDCSDTSQTVPELLTKFGSDGWELGALQEHREGGMGNSYWDAVRSVATYGSALRVSPGSHVSAASGLQYPRQLAPRLGARTKDRLPPWMRLSRGCPACAPAIRG